MKRCSYFFTLMRTLNSSLYYSVFRACGLNNENQCLLGFYTKWNYR
nr:MAG TPA: hypothetical protein [Caudoviricetes sp.]